MTPFVHDANVLLAQLDESFQLFEDVDDVAQPYVVCLSCRPNFGPELGGPFSMTLQWLNNSSSDSNFREEDF